MQYRTEDEALGTAGGVKNCADFYGDDDFLVISGDAACDFDLTRLMKACHNYRFQMHHAPDAILRTEAKFIILLLL